MRNHAIYQTRFGLFILTYTEHAITSIKRTPEKQPLKRGSALTDLAVCQLEQYFAGKRKVFDFPYQLAGTDFQQKVWAALCEIPYGQIRTYKDIALSIGNPKACRAVGMANNKNRLSIVVPCHRVIGSNGKLTGYASGLDMKQALLQLEARNSQAVFQQPKTNADYSEACSFNQA